MGNVTSTDAPTLILHGDGDCMISPLQAMHLYDALRFGGVYTQFFLVHGIRHDETWNATGMPAEIDSFLDVHLKNLGALPRPSR